MSERPTGRRGRRRHPAALVAWSALVLVALSWLAAPPAAAHASLVSTDPADGAVLAAPPETLTLTFDEPVSLTAEATRLFDATGAAVGAEARSVDELVTVTPDDQLGDGTFVLTYRVVSSDGHPIAGSLTFSVGAPSETVVTPDASTGNDPAVTAVHGVAQGVSYAALFLAAGLAVFLVLMLPATQAVSQVRQRLVRVMRFAAGTAVAGFFLLVPIGAVYQQGTGLGGLASRASWHLESFDALLFFLVVFGLGVTTSLVGAEPPDRSDRYVVPALAGSALAAVAIVGHTRAYGPAGLVVVSDIVHVVAAAVWFGGLVGLTLTLPALARREGLAAVTLARFSALAGALLGVVAVTGALLGWRILGSWSALATTPYGLLLLAKVGVVAAVASVAAWNRYRLLPSVLEATGHQHRVQTADRLRRTIRLEAVGLVAVLLLTGFLVNQVPKEETTAAAATDRDVAVAATDDVRVVARLDPATVGRNTLTVQLQDSSGEPLEPFAPPGVSVGSQEVDLGTRPVRNVDSGTYETEVVIPTAGRWEVQVSIRVDEFTNPVLTVPVEVGDG